MTLPRTGAGEWAASQASPWETVNLVLRLLDAGACRFLIEDRDLTAPPGSCADGACYLVGASPTGAWSGKAGKLAVAIGANAANGWQFITAAIEGVDLYVRDENLTIEYNGSSWVTLSAGAVGTAATLNFDTDGTLAANSDSRLPTQKAVKTYVDAAVVGLFDYKGTTDCSANPNYPAASKGDIYIVSVAGKIGGASGTSVDAGDWFIAKADNAGGTEASAGSSWGHIEHNIVVSDDAYDATSWNGNTDAPTKNAVRDKIEAIVAGAGTAASTTEQLTGTDATKLATPDSVAALWEQGSDVASAGTVSLGEGGYFVITGTTTITDIDFATDKAGRKAWVKFAGALTLTHNASTLILPGGASITTAAGDTACFVSEGSDVVRCVAYQKANGQAVSGGSGYSGGVQSTPVLAASMTARTTNGPATGSTESSTNKVMLVTLDFDASTAEYAQFMFPMPKSWNESTVTAQFIWSATNTGNVVWGIQGVAISDDDVFDAAFGTAQTVTDGVTATTDVMQSAFTSAVTIGGSPAEGDLVCFQVYRDAANGSDTLAVDARLIGIRLNFTTNAADDS